MNRNLSQLGPHFSGVWKQLGLNQRISIVLAGAAVIAVLTSLAFWSSRVDYGLLYGKLDDAEAAKVVGVLDEMKVPYKAGQAGGAIYVQRDKVHLMRMTLASKGLPRGDGVGFEIFDKPNFGISDFVQRANYLRALQGELARTIGQLDEIEAARVMIVLPENRLLLDNQKRATASVFVRTRGRAQLPPSAVNSIRFLVANSVEGLPPGQVSVVDNRGNVLSENSDADSFTGLTSGQLTARRSLEQYLAKKAEGMLEAVLGPGQAVVRVSADINFDQTTRTEEKFDPDGQVIRISTLNDENTETGSGGSTGGVPGVAGNVGDTNNSASPSAPGSKTKKKVTNNQYEINKVTSNLTQLAGGLKRMSAAVFVAARYETTTNQAASAVSGATARKPAPRPREELDKLRRIVQSALGVQMNADGTSRDEVTLEEIPFNDSLGDVAQVIGTTGGGQFWLDQAQKLIYPALAFGVLVMFLRMLKRTPVETIPLGVPVGQLAGENGNGSAGGNGQSGGFSPVARGNMQGVINPEVFNQLVRENPENLTQALQSWLDRGSVTAGSGPAKQP